MSMNNEAYTAYPAEGEILMCEGSIMFILSVDTEVLIENAQGAMAQSMGKKSLWSICSIHLLDEKVLIY